MQLVRIEEVLKEVQESGGGGGEREGSFVQEAFHQHGGDGEEGYEDTKITQKPHSNWSYYSFY